MTRYPFLYDVVFLRVGTMGRLEERLLCQDVGQQFHSELLRQTFHAGLIKPCKRVVEHRTIRNREQSLGT